MLGAKEEDFHERWSTSDGSPFGDTLEIPRSYQTDCVKLEFAPKENVGDGLSASLSCCDLQLGEEIWADNEQIGQINPQGRNRAHLCEMHRERLSPWNVGYGSSGVVTSEGNESRSEAIRVDLFPSYD